MFRQENDLEKINRHQEKETRLQELAAAQFARWNQALLSRDPHMVASLYSPEASFLPTLNPEFKNGQPGAEEYFHHFLEKNPEGKVVAEAVQEVASDQSGNTAAFLHSGLYDFLVGPAEQRGTAEARFTFLWQKDENGDWKIRHHHSSLKPVA
ncbi:MAG: SgcJ/EcaC family oxidoreductase [Patescibacteria group bacterium]